MTNDLIKETKKIPISSIDMVGRSRTDFGDVAGLWSAIKEHGLIHPPTVLDIGNSTYRLLAGERRIRAHIFGGETEVLCNIADRELDSWELKSIEYIENLQRKQLSDEEDLRMQLELHRLEQARKGPSSAGTSSGHSVRDTAALLNRPKTTVADDLRLAEAMEVMPELRGLPKMEARKILTQAIAAERKSIIVKNIDSRSSKLAEDEKVKRLCDSYVVGDFFEHVKSLPNSHFDIVECDPPFGIKLNEMKKFESINISIGTYTEVKSEEYKEFISSLTKECFRAMKPNSWLILWFAPHPHGWTVYEAVLAAGFSCRFMPCIWVKTNVPGQTNNPKFNLGNKYEMFLYARKGNPELQKRGRSNVFEYPTPSSTEDHLSGKPISLYRDIFETFSKPGDRLLVPFAGSGTSLLAAYPYIIGIGYDLNEDHRNDFVLNARQMFERRPKSVDQDICYKCGRTIPHTSEAYGTGICTQCSQTNN
jgi:ParB-like chromosome segregation protein Spo0J